jgi:hypothetical protein
VQPGTPDAVMAQTGMGKKKKKILRIFYITDDTACEFQ